MTEQKEVALGILKKAVEIMDNGWIKGVAYDMRFWGEEEELQFYEAVEFWKDKQMRQNLRCCASGALRLAHRIANENCVPTDGMIRDVVNDVLKEKVGHKSMIVFNDTKQTTYDDGRELFEAMIAEGENRWP